MTTAVCSDCRARRLAGEEEWTQNGDGWLCGRCAPPGRNEDKGEDEGEEYVQDHNLPTQPSSSSSSSSFHADAPALVDWLLEEYAAGRREPEPVNLPDTPPLHPNVQAVADFYRLVHGLRLTSPRFHEHPEVPFGCAWVGRHLGVSDTTVWRALRILEEARVVKRVGRLPGRGKLGVHTYLPGDGR
jgi:hypothetical protein